MRNICSTFMQFLVIYIQDKRNLFVNVYYEVKTKWYTIKVNNAQ